MLHFGIFTRERITPVFGPALASENLLEQDRLQRRHHGVSPGGVTHQVTRQAPFLCPFCKRNLCRCMSVTTANPPSPPTPPPTPAGTGILPHFGENSCISLGCLTWQSRHHRAPRGGVPGGVRKGLREALSGWGGGRASSSTQVGVGWDGARFGWVLEAGSAPEGVGGPEKQPAYYPCCQSCRRP